MSKNTNKAASVAKDLLDKLDLFLENRRSIIFLVSVAFSVLFSLLLFSIKMSEMGDDSGYILRAFKLLEYGEYPSFQGPFYPMFLSLFITLFGVNIILLKLLSLVFVLLGLIFFYKSLKDKIPNSILIPSFVLSAINYYILFFSSQTFSEALYLLLQSLFFYVLFRNDAVYKRDFKWKEDWLSFFLIGLVLFLGVLTRSVHLGVLAILPLFFLLVGFWKSSIASIGSYGLFWILYEGIKRFFWNNDLSQISSQGSQMLLKNPYNAQEGMETFSGYIDRLIGNSQYYISNAFLTQTGLREESVTISIFLTILLYFFMFLGLFLVFKKNKPLFFNFLYVGGLCLVTFVGLQTFWAQWRLIGIFYPFLLLAFFSTFYYGLKRFKKVQFLYPLLIVVMLFLGVRTTLEKTQENLPILKKNLRGDTFAGYAPEWKSFMEMSQWAAMNVPKETMIASRKPEMSFIYTGRPFYGVYRVPEVSLDTLRSRLNPDLVVLGLDPNQLIKTPVFEEIRTSVLCFAQGSDNSFYGVYQMDSTKAERIISVLQSNRVQFDLEVMQTFHDKERTGVRFNVVDPEKLVQDFVKNDVHYIILNSPNLFSTLYRYLTFIQLKYPRSLSTVNAIGSNRAQTTLVKFDHKQLD